VVTRDMVRSMAPDPAIFALANPDPEILPDEARKAGARIIATGRSDFPNQINNLLAFPGIFRGVMESRARKITLKMKTQASRAIASMIPEKDLSYDRFIPNATDKKIAMMVCHAVKKSI
ncbi:MAG: NAD-dependent malic enzyme, partial [bacterium]|nr:NAD-dependent malic enzyme [bacterium]